MTSAPKVGDIVLVEEQRAPHSKWPIGLIEHVDSRQAQASVCIVDADQTTRLMTPLDKSFPTKVFTSPVSWLYPFETSFTADSATQDEASVSNVAEMVSPPESTTLPSSSSDTTHPAKRQRTQV